MKVGKVGNITYDNQKYSRYHDLRLYKDGQWPEHIDRNRTKNNIVFANSTLEEVYAELFDGAVEKYNEKQSKPERKRADGGAGYLKELQNKLEMAEHKDKAIKPAFQIHIEVGDYYDTSYKKFPDDAAVAEQVLAEYFRGFEKRNPHMKVAWAVMHRDESKPGIHATIVPWADGYKKGMPRRTSISKALEQQGFTDDKQKSGWEKWIENERKILESVMLSHSIEPVRKNDPKRDKYTKSEMIQINKRVEKELQKIVNKPLGKIKRANRILGMVSGSEYEQLYKHYEAERAHRLASEELLKRVGGLEKKELLEQLEDEHSMNMQYAKMLEKERMRADALESELAEETARKEALETEVKMLRADAVDLSIIPSVGRRKAGDRGIG